MLSGLSKKLTALGKEKECELVKRWIPSIKNHIYWTASTSTTKEEKLAKWKSVLNHIQDVHIHDDPLYPKCLHPIKVTTDKAKWFQPGSLLVYFSLKVTNIRTRSKKPICNTNPYLPF